MPARNGDCRILDTGNRVLTRNQLHEFEVITSILSYQSLSWHSNQRNTISPIIIVDSIAILGSWMLCWKVGHKFYYVYKPLYKLVSFY